MRAASGESRVRRWFVCWDATLGTLRVPMITAQKVSDRGDAFPLLRQTELRHLLSEPQLQELERYCRPSFKKVGATLFRQGDPADSFYLLAEGMVELRARPPGRRA